MKPISIETYLYPASRRKDTHIVVVLGSWWKAWTISRRM